MQKKLLIIKILLFICTIAVVYMTYLNLHPWYTGNYDGKIMKGTLGLICLWFALYCLIIYKHYSDIDLSYEKKRTIVFLLPLYFLLMNIGLTCIIYKMDRLSDIQVVCLLLMLLFAIVVLFYKSIKYNVLIWYPFSFYCSIYALPVREYTGVEFLLLAGLVLFSFIEYTIMLFLNRREWYVEKDKKGTQNTVSSQMTNECNIIIDHKIKIAYKGLILCIAFAVVISCLNLFTLLILHGKGVWNLPLALLIMIACFGCYCYLIYQSNRRQYSTEGKRIAIIIPMILVVMNTVIAIILYFISFYYYALGNSFDLIELLLLMLLFGAGFIIFKCMHIGKRNNIYLWYPISFFCAIYASPASLSENGLWDASGYLIFLSIGMFFFGIIEFIIMLYLNYKKVFKPKKKIR